MQCKFYSNESRIYDFMQFPRLLFYHEIFEGYNKIHENIVLDDYLDFVSKVQSKINLYSKDIEIFYMKQYSNDYDFINLIFMNISFFDYKDEKDYLNMLLSLNEHEIKRSLIHSMLLIEQGQDDEVNPDIVMKNTEEICFSNNETIAFIKGLPIDTSFKWNLFLIVEEPLKYMKLFVELMTKLLPIFDDIYTPFQEEINRYGNYLTDFLNQNGTNGLQEITFSIIDQSYLDENMNKILISFIFSYTISFTANKYIAWGLKMEEAFKKMKEVNENKTNERVQIFKNLGDKTRYEVLKLISSGITSTKDIANTLEVSSATISYHINALLTSRVIKLDNSNKKFSYVVDYKLLEEILKDFKEDLPFPKS